MHALSALLDKIVGAIFPLLALDIASARDDIFACIARYKLDRVVISTTLLFPGASTVSILGATYLSEFL